MYVGGPLDTAPATPSSTSSRSQASHREVKVRKVNSSHSASPFALEHRELGDQAGIASRRASLRNARLQGRARPSPFEELFFRARYRARKIIIIARALRSYYIV